jgi:thiamine-phosphate pyrophosphorylase
VTYSPVWATASKPGYGPALGPEGLRVGCDAVPGTPVVALGGIGVGSGRVAACRASGAAAVAVMGEVMRARDIARSVRALLAEWEGGGVDTVREAS